MKWSSEKHGEKTILRKFRYYCFSLLATRDLNVTTLLGQSRARKEIKGFEIDYQARLWELNIELQETKAKLEIEKEKNLLYEKQLRDKTIHIAPEEENQINQVRHTVYCCVII